MERTDPQTTTTSAIAPGETAGAMRSVVRTLGALRATARAMLVTRATALLVAAAVGVAVGVGLADYLLRLPEAVRVVLWVAGVGSVLYGIVRLVRPAIRFAPSLTDLALRIEASEHGRDAELTGLLASGLELGLEPNRGDPGALEHHLRLGVARRARERFAHAKPWHIVSVGRTVRALGVLIVAVGGVAVLAQLSPTLTAIGARRVLTPWSDAAWPRRTELADATLARVHPLGVVLELRAALVRTNHELGRTRVAARYRVIRDGEASPTRRVLLTSQLTHGTIETRDGAVAGELYERPIETPQRLDADELSIEYWFETDDAQTEPRRVLLVPPPRIVAARVTVTPPTYAQQALAADTAILAGEHDLGDGRDERAVAGPILAGSMVELTVLFNKPLPMAEDSDALAAAWSSALVPGAEDGAVVYEARDDEAVARLTIARSIRLVLRPEDEHALRSTDEAVFSLDVVDDAPPTAAVVEPAHDETVLASAVIELIGEGRDDLALTEVWLERQLARPPRGSQGGVPGAIGDAVVLTRTSPDAVRQARVRATLDLATTGARPGDELWITAHARDGFVLGGSPRAGSISPQRRLIIITPAELVERVRSDLAALQEAARRIDELQAQIQRRSRRQGPTEQTRQAQDGIGEQIAAQREIIDRLEARVTRNNLNDEAIAGVLDDSGRALDAARAASDRAQQGIDESRANERTDERDAQIDRDQSRVRDELGRLAEMLDRGEDDWVVRRQLERLLEEQQRLHEQTRAIGDRTFGRSVSDLTEQELSELDRIAQRQAEAADRVSETLDDLNERGRDLETIDPAKSMGMQQAAQRGRQSQLEQQMRDAAQQVGQNQTGAASTAQQEIVEQLERMIQDLDEAQRNRDEALKRILASVIESIRSLITQQQRQLDELDLARGEQTFGGLDAAMIRVNTNTLGVLDQVATSGDELAPVTALIEQAVAAQGQSIRLLRADPVDDLGVEDAEQASLQRLRDALAEAQKLEKEAQERDQARKRAELRQQYREALEQQVAVRSDTEPMVRVEQLSRRQRQAVRGLGERQDAIRSMLGDLLDATEGMASATMFVYAHDRLAMVTQRASGTMRTGRVDPAVLRDQATAIRVLRSLVEALREPEQDDDFREDDGGGGGGGSGGQGGDEPLIPPIAELMLLREMQAEALQWTRDADADAIDPSEADDLAMLQRELSELGLKLIEQMQQQQQGSPPLPQESPGEPPTGPPTDPGDTP